MTDAGLSVSLLPYLDSTRGTSHLKISLATQEPSLLEKITTPFLVIDDSDPFARLMEAQFLTDAGNVLRKAFLLVQRDRYRITEDELWPVFNPDVENAWQHAFSFFNAEGDRRQLTALSSQITEGGKLIPLTSLFFCKTRQVFFCPPCPKCGTTLQQCIDDGLLSARGLQPYSRSLRRYLFCPSCDAQGPADFYTYELDNHDPPELKDRWALIKEFGLLLESNAIAGEFPCGSCDRRSECFGWDVPASSRIVPFSFYPFHMLIVEAMSLHAVDFLALLSGATHEEVEARLRARGEFGRLNCLRILRETGLLETRFLYDHQEKFFLEVLYLKLSFLGEVAKVLATATAFEHPDLRLSLDRIWVKLADQSGLLPSFWTFRAGPVNVGGPTAENATIPGSPSNSALYFVGQVWFYALLVNKRQDITEVSRLLKESLLRGISFHGPSADTPVADGRNPVFSPTNIFWDRGDKDGKDIPERWHALWEKSLELGWSLWVAGIHGDPSWSQGEFFRQFTELREEVKHALFEQMSDLYQEPYPRTVRPAQQRSDDATIHDALVNLIARWRADAEEEPVARPETRMEEGKELTQTVIVSVGDLKKEASQSPAKAGQISEETVIVSVGAEEMVPETVIISAPEIGKQAQLGVESKGPDLQNAEKKKVKEQREDESLAETVVLNVEKKKK